VLLSSGRVMQPPAPAEARKMGRRLALLLPLPLAVQLCVPRCRARAHVPEPGGGAATQVQRRPAAGGAQLARTVVERAARPLAAAGRVRAPALTLARSLGPCSRSDSALPVRRQQHGFGQWDRIRADPSLAFHGFVEQPREDAAPAAASALYRWPPPIVLRRRVERAWPCGWGGRGLSGRAGAELVMTAQRHRRTTGAWRAARKTFSKIREKAPAVRLPSVW
jgi:hypothetical protein